MSFAAAEQIADAVLYEGYALYPYRASSTKNRVRWQFGVVAPREYAERSGSDPWFAQTECLVEPDGAASLDVRIRGLQVEARTIEVGSPDGGWSRIPTARVGDREIVEWDEGIERTADHHGLSLDMVTDRPVERLLDFHPTRDVEMLVDDAGRAIRVVRETSRVNLRTLIEARSTAGFVIVRVRVENITGVGVGIDARDAALRHALVGTHTLLSIRGGRFLSLLDPPPGASDAVAACRNQNAWPVLVGDPDRRDLMLSAPIILYDYPAIAPQSPGNLFDGTEIDEILTLRIMTLTDSEKAEARATDVRARDIVDRADTMSAEGMAKLHGVMHGVGSSVSPTLGAGIEQVTTPDDYAWRTLLNPDTDAPPDSAVADVQGVGIFRGSRVVLRPVRRADPMDMFLTGRLARVEGVYRDLEGRGYVAVVLDDDPAGEFHAQVGRFFYYGLEEIEPAGPKPAQIEEQRT